MSVPQAHDYTILSVEKMSDNVKNEKNFKETELRLGLPGSESPERNCANGVSIFGKELKDENISGFCHSPLKGFVSGAKRGFSDAINGSGKWGLSSNGGSEVDLVKGDGLFSPRGVSGKNNSGVRSCLAENYVKEVCNTPPPVKAVDEKKSDGGSTAPASQAQVVGWPPIRSFRKNTLATNSSKDADVTGKSGSGCLYVKVSMDGAPYLRKIDLNTYCSYSELSSALEKMFSCFTIGKYGHGVAGQEHLTESRLMDLLHGSEYVLTYEDKDGDWMLVGDVPWEMFTDSCKRLRIMKGSDAIGLAPRTMQKSKSQS